MKLNISAIAKPLVGISVNLFSRNKYGRYVYSLIVRNTMDQKQTVKFGDVKIVFHVPNRLNKYRADSFASKEPETLQWIDSIPSGSILWDIGANVGLYSCYAAKSRNCLVYAFEPSVFNIELLARNIFQNELTKHITIVPLPLSDKLAENTLNMTSKDWGGALSSFGETYGQDGQEMEKIFEFKTIGLTMLDAVNLLKIPLPDYIKIDVDGIEHLILKGGNSVLENVKGVIIEIDESFERQFKDSGQYLTEAGLVMKYKSSADKSADPKLKNCYNQVWVKQI